MYINCQVNLSQIEIEPVASINNELQQLMLEMGDKEARRIHVTKGGSSPAPARARPARERESPGEPGPARAKSGQLQGASARMPD